MTKPKGKKPVISSANSTFRPYSYLVLAIVLVYGQILTFGLVQFDDHGFVLLGAENLKLSNSLEFFRHSVFWVLGDTSQEFDVFYRPVQNLVYAVCNTIASQQPWIFHLTGLLLHLVAVITLYRFFQELKLSSYFSLIASLLFAVHPVLVQGVAWIAGMGDQLATICSLWAMIFFIRTFTEDTSMAVRYFYWHLLFFSIGLFSKEITLMVMIAALAWYSFLQTDKSRQKLVYVYFSAWTFVVVVYFILRNNALKAEGGGLTSSLIPSMLQNGKLIFEYLEKIFLPWRLSPIPSRDDAQLWVGLVLTVMIVAWMIYKKRITYLGIFGLIWFLIFLLPTFIQQNPEAHFFAFEHRLYLPLIGLWLFVGEVLALTRGEQIKPAGLYVAGGVVGLLGLISFFHARTFKDPHTFYEKALSSSPKSVIAYNGYGKFLLTEKDYAGAIGAFKKSYELKPDDIETSGKIASLYMEQLKDPASAAVWYQRSLQTDPRSIKAAVSLAEVYWNSLKDTLKAETAYKQALSIEPENTHALTAMGNIQMAKGRHEEARQYLHHAIQSDTTNLMAYKWLAISLFSSGEIQEAVDYLLKAYAQYPEDADVLRNLAICYFQLKDAHNSSKFIEECRKRGISLPEIIN